MMMMLRMRRLWLCDWVSSDWWAKQMKRIRMYWRAFSWRRLETWKKNAAFLFTCTWLVGLFFKYFHSPIHGPFLIIIFISVSLMCLLLFFGIFGVKKCSDAQTKGFEFDTEARFKHFFFYFPASSYFLWISFAYKWKFNIWWQGFSYL